MNRLLLLITLSLAFSPKNFAQYCQNNLYTTGCTFGSIIYDFSLDIYQHQTFCSMDGYGDYTSDTISLEKAINYSYTVSSGQSSMNYIVIWIDFNDDGDFNDTLEFMGGSGTVDFGPSYTGTLTIDSSAAIGAHRMRVRVTGSPIHDSDACTQYNEGEVHDYIVDVLPVAVCPRPADLDISQIMSSEALLTYTSFSSLVNIEYGVSGFNKGTGTVISGITSNPYSLTGLAPNTTYEVYIQDDCGATDGQSLWYGPVSFTTRFAPYIAPWTETFDTATNSNLPAGWLTYSSTSKEWHTTASIFNSAPADHTSGSGNYAFVYDLQNPDPNTPDVTAVTPLVDISLLTRPVLQFYYWSAPSSGIYRLTVDLWDGAQWQSTVFYDTAGTAGQWKQMVVDVSQTVSDTVMARFIVDEDNGSTFPANHVAIDDVGFVESPLCPTPHSLKITNIGTTTATVDWKGFAGENYNIEYGLTGFVPGSGTSVSSSSLQEILSGLNANSSYDVYLSKDCSTGIPDTLGPVSFTTNCEVVSSFPFAEDFDGSPWSGVSGFSVSGDVISNCWSRNPANEVSSSSFYAWTLRTGPSLLPDSGPLTDFSGSGNYFTTHTSYGSTGDEAYLYFPEFDFSSLDTPMVSFYYHMFGPEIGSLSLQVSTDSAQTWATVRTFTGQQHLQKNAYWTEALNSLYNYKSNYTLLRFKSGHGNGFKGDVAIDNITVREKATCENPTNLRIIETNDTSVTLTFDSDGSNFIVTWGPPGFIQGTTTANFSNDTITLNGLNPNACYEVIVYNDCPGSSASLASLPILFCTECATISGFPWLEDFEANGINCWDVINGTQDFNQWELDSGNTAHSPKSAAHIFMNFSDQDWLISPKIQLTGNQRMTYWHRKFMLNEDPELTVLISTTGKDPADFTDTLVASYLIDKVDYVQKQVFLDNYSGDVYIAFHAGGNTYGNISLDDILIEDIPACIEPYQFRLSAVDTTHAYFKWDNFGGSDFVFEYGTSGYIPGTGTLAQANGSYDTLSGLIPDTDYDVYIQQDCGTDSSVWVGPVSFKTLCSAYSMPYLETFDTWPLSCWDTTRGRGLNFWHEYIPTSGGSDHHALAYLQTPGFDSAIFVSPPVMISDPAQLEFYWSHKWSGLYAEDSLLVRIQKLGSGIWDTLTVLQGYYDYNDPKATGGGFGNPGTPGDFVHEKIILDSNLYTGSAVIVEFWASTKYNSPFSTFINDFSIIELADCIDPDSLFVDGITTTDATVNWFTNTTSGSDIWYGPTGFNQASNVATLMTNVSSPYTLTGLLPGTVYDVYVRDSCASGSISDWVGPFTFTTPCYSQALSTPYFDDFENINGVNCYKIVDVNYDGNKWENIPVGQTVSGTRVMGILTNYTNGDNNDWLITPQLKLGAQDSISFYYRTEVAGWFVEPDTMVVRISTNSNELSDFSTVLWSTKIINTNYKKVAIDLAAYANMDVYFAIQIPAGYDGVRNLVDNLFIGENSGCVPADSLHAIGVNCDSVTLSWHSASAVSSIIEYDTAGFAQGSGIKLPNVSSPVGINGLDAGKTYEFYVAELCVNGDTSAYTGPFSFTVDSLPLPTANFTIDTATGNPYQVNFDASASTGNALKYYWDFGDGTLDSGSTVSHTFSMGGNFTVSLTVVNSCGQHDTSITLSGIDLKEIEWVRSFSLFPNPAHDRISIDTRFSDASDIELLIYDASGKRVLIEKFENTASLTKTLDIGKWTSGIYYLRLQSEFGVISEKFIVH